jgi:hypothetical protein
MTADALNPRAHLVDNTLEYDELSDEAITLTFSIAGESVKVGEATASHGCL